MELDEFDVADGGTGAVGGGYAIAGGDVGVGGFKEHAAESAGGEEDSSGVEVEVFSGFLLKDLDAVGCSVEVEEEIGHPREAGELNAFNRRRFAVERAGDFATGGVAMGVEDAVTGVGTFAGEEEAGAVFVEFRAPIDEFLNGSGSFLHESVDGWDVAEAVAGVEGVVFVEADFVVVTEGDGDATLGVLRS